MPSIDFIITKKIALVWDPDLLFPLWPVCSICVCGYFQIENLFIMNYIEKVLEFY